MVSNQPPKQKKKGHAGGWCAATVDTLLKNMNKNKAMRAGSRDTKWTNIHSKKIFTFKVPALMIIDSFKSGC